MSASFLSRRGFVLGALALFPVASGLALAEEADALTNALAELEAAQGARLGVALFEEGRTELRGSRMDERFALCSTFKLLLAGWVLARCERGEEHLEATVKVRGRQVVMHSPVTQVGGRFTVEELCRAAVTTSDNTATNLLLERSGGPAGLTAFLRGLGDEVTRLDRIEPELNDVRLLEGDLRDTTTPAAMARTSARLLLGDALPPERREVLVGWARATVTGLDRLRKDWPESWSPGDKTGTGMDRYTNDVAVAWPPEQPPRLVAAYLDRPGHSSAENNGVLAEVGALVMSLG